MEGCLNAKFGRYLLRNMIGFREQQQTNSHLYIKDTPCLKKKVLRRAIAFIFGNS